MDVIATLTKEQFLTWKNSILEMQLSEARLAKSTMYVELMQKDLQIQQLKINAMKSELDNKRSEHTNVTEAYHAHRESLETELGLSLKDSVIDEMTLEVKRV